jgi:hypothetical protein
VLGSLTILIENLVSWLHQPEWASVTLSAFSVLISFFTLIAMLLTLLSIKDQSRRQLRAYLCISDSLVKFMDDGSLEAQLYLKNGGQTPAYEVKCWSNPTIREYPLRKPLGTPRPTMPIAAGIIPPQGHHIIIATKFKAPDVVMQSIKTQNAAFYVHGEAVYRDIFGNRGIYLTPPTPRYSVLGYGRGLSEDAA